MSSKIVVVIVVAALAGGMWWFSRGARFPGGADPRPSTVAAFDASDVFTDLMRRGVGARDELRRKVLAKSDGEDAARLAGLLPTGDESWVARVTELRTNPPKPPYPPPAGVEIVEPRGVLLASHRRILVRRAMPGRLTVRITRLGGSKEEVEIDQPIGRWEALPETFAFTPGARYRITASDGETVVAENTVEVLGVDEERDFRERISLLKRYVSETRPRLYGHAVLAMSRGLHAEASEILLRRLARADGTVEPGLETRLAFLNDRRGRKASRDEALRRLGVEIAKPR